MSEDFVDVHWRGLEVARKARLKPDGRGVGQLEHGTPMPIGTALTVRTAGQQIVGGAEQRRDLRGFGNLRGLRGFGGFRI